MASKPAAIESNSQGRYEALNRTFDRKLVFRVGASAGFFSEYNNMLYAMLYCLEHSIRFVLYSRAANFAAKEGWTDYFMPFTSETGLSFHSRYNHRTQAEHERSGASKRTWTKRIFQKATGTDYLTHDLFEEIRRDAKSARTYSYPALGIDGDIREACRSLVEMTWRYRSDVSREIASAIGSLNLPSRYVGLHVRVGDKHREAPLTGIARYIDKAASRSDLRAAFVATDDFNTVRLLRSSYPEWKFFTLAPETSDGYDQATFRAQSRDFKARALMELFASVEALASAELFVGTFSSNVGTYMGFRLPAERCLAVDAESWYVW